MVACATALASTSSTASAEWTYLMLSVLWQSRLAMVGSL